MISFTFFFLASIINSIMDTLKDHFSVSIFKNLNPNFWNPTFSWKNKIFNYVAIDAWHISKTCMLGCIYCSIVFYTPVFGYYDLLILPCIWGVGFELFYSHILRNENLTIK